MSSNNRIVLALVLSTAALARTPAAHAQTRLVTAQTPLTTGTIGHKVSPAPYAIADLGPIAKDAPLGCYSDNGIYYGTRDVSGHDRAFEGGPGYRSDLYYYTNANDDGDVYGCNANRTAVGTYMDQAIVWDAALPGLEMLTVQNAALFPMSSAVAVNANRQIVGSATLDWDGVFTQYPVLGNTSVAFNPTTGHNQPTETMVLLPNPVGSSFATAINNQGEIVGNTLTPVPGATGQTIPSARYWLNNADHTLVNLLPKNAESQANDINNDGLIAGWLTYSMADALNDAGVVIGRSQAGNTVWATVWINGVAHGLPYGTQPLLTEATSINGAGDIVAGGIASDGLRHAYLLTPNAGGVWP
jgi:hypothetical protein